MKKPASKTAQRAAKGAAHDPAGVKQLKQAAAPDSGISFTVQKKGKKKVKQKKAKSSAHQLMHEDEHEHK